MRDTHTRHKHQLQSLCMRLLTAWLLDSAAFKGFSENIRKCGHDFIYTSYHYTVFCFRLGLSCFECDVILMTFKNNNTLHLCPHRSTGKHSKTKVAEILLLALNILRHARLRPKVMKDRRLPVSYLITLSHSSRSKLQHSTCCKKTLQIQDDLVFQ